MNRAARLAARVARCESALLDAQRSLRDHIVEQACRHALTGGEIASKTGVSRTYVCRLLRGEDYPSGKPLIVPDVIIDYFANL